MNKDTLPRLCTKLLAFVILLAAACSSRATTITWTNVASGSWHTATNWSPNQVPGGGDSAIITNNGVTVSLATDADVGSLTLGDNFNCGSGGPILTVAGHTLRLYGNFTIGSCGQFTLDSGALSGNTPNATVSGTMGWTGGLLAGTLTFAGGSTFNIAGGGVVDFPNCVVTNLGTVNWSAGQLRGAGCGSSQIFNYGLWNCQGDTQVNAAYGCGVTVFNNFGTFRKSVGAGDVVFTGSCPFNNAGVLDILSGTLVLQAGGSFSGGSATNFPGVVQLAGGVFTINGMVTSAKVQLNGGELRGNNLLSGAFTWIYGDWNSSTVTVATNSVLSIAGGGVNDFADVRLTNYGTVAWSSGAIRGGGCSGSLIYNYGLWDSQGDLVVNNAYGCGVTVFNNFGTLRKSGGSPDDSTQFQGSVILNNQGILDIEAGVLSLQAGGTFSAGSMTNGTGLIQLAAGGFNINGTVTSTNVQLIGASLVGNNLLTGAFTWISGPINGTTVTIATNSLLKIAGTGLNDMADFRMTNYGTVAWTSGTIRGGGCGAALIYNYGLWDLQADLVFNNAYGCSTTAFNNYGTLRKSVGASTNSTQFQGGVYLNNYGDVDIRSGTLSLQAGGSFLAGTVTNSVGFLQLNAGTYTLNGTFTTTNFQLAGATFGGNNVINGSIAWLHGVMDNNAALTVATNGLLNIVSSASGEVFFNCVVTNYGTVAWKGGTLRTGGCSSTVFYNYGLWDCQDDLIMNDDAGCANTAFNNYGTLRKSAGAPGGYTQFKNGVFFNNTGNMDVRAGTLLFQGGGNLIGGTDMKTTGLTVLGGGTWNINGTITSTSVQLDGGVLRGNNILSNGITWVSADWDGSAVTIATNTVLNITGGGLHDLINTTLTNYGSVTWTDGIIRGGGCGASSVFNYGLWDIQGDLAFQNTGCANGIFYNYGTLRKSLGTNVATFDGGIFFNNFGDVAALNGSLNFNSTPTLTSGNLIFGISDPTNFGVINAAGTVTLNGGVGAILLNGFVPALGSQFTVMHFGNTNGVFTDFTGLNPGGGIAFTPTISNTSLTLATVATNSSVVPPTIITQPATQVVNYGDTVTMQVVASGSPPLLFQWFTNNVPLLGATNSKLVLTNVQFTQAGLYKALVTNSASGIFSQPAQLTVQPVLPQITLQPQTITVPKGSNASFTVAVNAQPPAKLQWQFNSNNIVNSGRITGAQSLTLNIANVQTSDAGSYRLIASNDFGVAISDTAVLKVNFPDLVVANVTAPTNAVLGQPVDLVFTITNAADGEADGPWQNTFLISSTNNGTGLQVLGYSTFSGIIAARSSIVVTQTVQAPANLSGFYYLGVVVNSASNIPELSTANNTNFAALPVNIVGPDLSPTKLTVPPNATFGQSFNVSFTVTNTGTAGATASWHDYIYLSTSPNSIYGATYLAGPSGTSPLTNGAGYSRNQSVTLPVTTSSTAGNYYIVLAVNGDSGQVELTQTNNLLSAPISFALPPLPDLVAGSVGTPASAVTGQSISVSWSTTNIGPGVATSPWREAVYLVPANLTAAQFATNISAYQLVGAFTFTNDLASSSSLTRSQQITIPVSGLAGDLRAAIVVDSDNVVLEQNETNNVALATNDIQVPLTLSLNLPTTNIFENTTAPNLGCLITRNGSVAAPLTVTLTSSATNHLQLPPSVTIPAGQASAPFTALVLDDGIPNADALVTIGATAPSYQSANAQILVYNTDVPKLTFSVATPSVNQGQTLFATVTSSTTSSNAVNVTLASSNPNALTPPSVVAIPANSNSVSFFLLAVQNTIVLPPQSYTVSASALGYASGSTNVTVYSTNTPVITLSLSRTNINEDEGAYAVVATVSRQFATDQALNVTLTSSNTGAARVPTQVTIPSLQSSVAFNIAAVNDPNVTGPKTTVIAAQSLDLIGNPIGNPDSEILIVEDVDGPSLKITLANPIVLKGLNPATTGTVIATVAPTNNLVVALKSSATNEATVPVSVTILAGQTNATFNIASLNDGLPQTSTPLIISASATNYASGSVLLTVSDLAQPDLVISSITAPGTAYAAEPLTVNFRLSNQGLGSLTNSVTQSAYLTTDPVSGSYLPVGSITFPGPLAAGQFVDQSLIIPGSMLPGPGTYYVAVTADANNSAVEINEANNTLVSSSAIVISPEYTVTITPGVTAVNPGTTIPLTGSATLIVGGPAPFKPVNILINVRGIQRVVSTMTDANGAFSTVFTPLAMEAGHYTVAAVVPGVTSAPAQASFDIRGFSATPSSLAMTIAAGSGLTSNLTLQNLSEIPLTGITATANGLAANLSANITVANFLDSQAAINLACAVTATDSSIRQSSFTIHLATTEGFSLDIPVSVTVNPLLAHLVATPASLSATMLRGGQTVVTFSLANQGGAASGPLMVNLPDVTWMSVASTNPLPSIAPGASNLVSLLLTPDSSMALGPYSGSFNINGGGIALNVPFTFTAVSDAHGALNIQSVDEYTYFASNSPPLTNASINVIDPFTQAIVAVGNTGPNGQVIITNLMEGVYEVDVSSPQHSPFRGSATVSPGMTNTVLAFLSRQTVTYVWSVVPTTIQDTNTIVIQAQFEANVPAPVIVPTPATIDLAPLTQPGQVLDIPLTLVNYGLIAVHDVALNIGTHPLYRFDTLTTQIGDLPAHGSVTIPIRITRLAEPAKTPSPQNVPTPGAPCNINFGLKYSYPCGPFGIQEDVAITVQHVSGNCTPVPIGTGISVGCVNCGSAGYGGWGGVLSGPGNGSGRSVTVPPSFSLPEQCDPCYAKAVVDCIIGFTPIGCYYGAFNCGMALGGGINALSIENCVFQAIGCLGPLGNAVACTESIVRCRCPQNDGCITGLLGGGGGASPQTLTPDVTAGLGLNNHDLRDVYAARTYTIRQLMAMQLGDNDGRWFTTGSGAAMGTWYTAFSQAIQTNTPNGGFISPSEATNLLSLPVPGTVTPADVQFAIDRWNLSLSNWNAGTYTVTNLAPGANTNFIDLYAFTNQLAIVSQQFQIAQSQGFDSPVAGLIAALSASGKQAGASCARVVIEIDQSAVLTRDAFHATLQLNNNSPDPLNNVTVSLKIQNQAGKDVTSLFGIQSPTISGALTGVNGSGIMPGNGTGSAQWTLIPSIDAAPTDVTNYLVSGTFSYVQNGATITIPLAPAPITVQPSPQLYLNYFLQRDVYADDPFTPEIEPSLPFPLAVMVQNKGYGVAQNFSITSAQPKIVDNEKGLLINFQIIGTQVDGQAATPSLTADFGNIAPQSTKIGEWFFTASLQGLFVGYTATFTHVDPLGNPRLSLIQGVDIHELIHLVQAPDAWDDGHPDFLANEIPNFGDLPDTLFLSDGSSQPVSVVQAVSTDAPASTNHLNVLLTANFPAGFTYVVVPDPANGQLPLVAVQHTGGSNLLAPNFYTTDRTFIGLGQTPLRENNLHFLDYHTNAGTYSYTVVYTMLTNALQTNAPLSSVFALPPVSPITFGVAWNGAPFVGQAPLAYYDIYVSDNGSAYTNWQAQTKATGGIFTGQQGHTYTFYSVSTDTLGNREAIPSVPQAQTTVNPTTYAPTISVAPGVTISAGQTLSLPVTATDSNIFANLTFTIGPDAPSGATVDPLTGKLTWATSLLQGGTTNLIKVIVTDNSQPPLSATGTVQVIVQKVIFPPALAPIQNYTITDGQLLTFTASATDSNTPPLPLKFSFGPGAPTKATIDTNTGVFSWRPAASQAPSTNVITIIVSDNASPVLTATQQFTVIVRKSTFDVGLAVGSTNILAGNTGSVPLVLNSSLLLTNLSVILQGPGMALTNFTLQAVSPEVTSTLLQPLGSNQYSLNFGLNPAASPGDIRTLGQLGFLAPSSQPHSAIATLGLSQLVGTQADGTTAPKPATGNGRVFLIAHEPLLNAWSDPAGGRKLALYGFPFASYEMDYTTNLASGKWQLLRRIPMTNSYALFDGDNKLPGVYYRAFQFAADPPIMELHSFSPTNFELLLYGRGGSNYTVLSGTNLAGTNWTSIAGFTLTNSFQFINTGGPSNQSKFFKIQRH